MPKKPSWARKNLRSLHESLQTRSLFQCRPWISWVLCRNQECGRRVKRQWLLKKKIKLYLNGNGASNQPQTEMDLTTFMFSCDNFDLQEDLRYFADTAMERFTWATDDGDCPPSTRPVWLLPARKPQRNQSQRTAISSFPFLLPRCVDVGNHEREGGSWIPNRPKLSSATVGPQA